MKENGITEAHISGPCLIQVHVRDRNRESFTQRDTSDDQLMKSVLLQGSCTNIKKEKFTDFVFK